MEAKMDVWRRVSQFIPTMFGAVCGANILTMSAMNFFEVPTRFISVFYLAFLVLTTLLMLRCKLDYPLLSQREHLLCTTFALAFFLPRIPYLFESVIGYSLLPVGDDWFHIPDLASVIHTERFPPRSTYDSSQYLAYYYAAWIPGAAIYYTGLISTVKQALALTKLLYSFFIVYFPVYSSKVLFPEQKYRTAFLVLCFLYGGFDFFYWASSLDFVPRHSEWWAEDFGFEVQFSNFFTLSLWTPQHFLAGLSILFGLYVISVSESALAQALSGLFFLSGLFSSPFTTLGTIPLVIWYLVRFGKMRALTLSAVVFTAISMPLWWILLGNDHVGLIFFGALASNWIEHKPTAFAVFVLVILLELGPLITAAAYTAKQNGWLRWPFVVSSSYILSTFFIFYHSNYSMRGSIIPIFTLTYLATPPVYSLFWRVPYRWLRVIAAAYLLGGLLEYASFTKGAIEAYKMSRVSFNAAALKSNSGPDKNVSMELIKEAARYEWGWYVLEKPKPMKKNSISESEAVLMHPDNHYRLTFSKVLEHF